MRNVAAREGYAGASIARVIADAHVSRPTFYDYFTEKDECFLAALTDAQERLLGDVRRAVDGRAARHAAAAAIEALVGFARSQPAMARVLMGESMAAGPRALDARDEGIAEIAQIIEDAYEGVPPATPIPDLSPRMMIGGVYRLISSTLRRGEPAVAGLLEDLSRWVESYEQPLGAHRWRTLTPLPAPPPSPSSPGQSQLRAPPALRPGRGGLSKQEVAENHRQRILFATAQVAREKGYGAATIADITSLARVDRRAFGALFTGKQDAFMAIHELGFQRTMAVAAVAFFARASWPERVWQAGRVSAEFLARNPTIAHIGFVESYAVGADAIKRVEDSLTAFTIFLQEGYQHEPRKSTPPSRLALEAIAATNYEIAYQQTRGSANPELPGLLAHVTHLALAPFLGAAQANRFIDEQLHREHAADGDGPPP